MNKYVNNSTSVVSVLIKIDRQKVSDQLVYQIDDKHFAVKAFI